jgi:hypothetical protein
MDQKFIQELIKIGIISYKEQETLFQIAKRCAATTGMPMAGAGALIGLKAGSITVPGIGTIAGPVAGALAGMISGTVSCTMLNAGMRKELQGLARGQ